VWSCYCDYQFIRLALSLPPKYPVINGGINSVSGQFNGTIDSPSVAPISGNAGNPLNTTSVSLFANYAAAASGTAMDTLFFTSFTFTYKFQ